MPDNIRISDAEQNTTESISFWMPQEKKCLCKPSIQNNKQNELDKDTHTYSTADGFFHTLN